MTAQSSDPIRFEGRWYSLSCEPLINWLWRRKNKGLRFQRTNTACARGYQAEWLIERGRLYLASISGTMIDGSPITLDALFANYSKQYLDSVGANDPANAGPGAFAFWVTGTVGCRFGSLLRYVHAGYSSVYSGELHLCMQDGFLVGSRIVHHERPRRREREYLDES